MVELPYPAINYLAFVIGKRRILDVLKGTLLKKKKTAEREIVSLGWDTYQFSSARAALFSQ